MVPHTEITVNPQGNEATLNHWQKLAERLKTNKNYRTFTFVSFTALVENGNKLKVVQVKGVDKQAEDQVSSLGKFVEGNGWQKFAEEGGLVLGSGIAKELDVKAGDWVSLLISQPNGEDQMAQPNRGACSSDRYFAFRWSVRPQLCLTGIASSTRINGVSRRSNHRC